MPISTIKKLWEKIDGRVGLLIGWIVGLATHGIWLSLKAWVEGSWLWSKLFGWIINLFN